jgi:hypothetical protein
VSRTSAAGVYAAGDCTGVLPLASVAAMQGRIAMWHSLGDAVTPLDLRTVSSNVFTAPEIATVGVSHADVDSGRVPGVVVKLPLATNARAKMQGIRDGSSSSSARPDRAPCSAASSSRRGPSELFHPVTLAVTQRLTVDDVANTFTVYPSLSGSVAEAAAPAAPPRLTVGRRDAAPGRVSNGGNVPTLLPGMSALVEWPRERLVTGFRAIVSGNGGSIPDWVRDLEHGDDEGYFGPESAVWAVHGNLATLVGGIRALLVQAPPPGGGHRRRRALDLPRGSARPARWHDALAHRHDLRLPGRSRPGKAPECAGCTGGSGERTRTPGERSGLTVPGDEHLLAGCTRLHGVVPRLPRGLRRADPGGPDAYVREWATAAERVGLTHAPRSVADLEAQMAAYEPELVRTPATERTVAFLRNPPLSPPALVGTRCCSPGPRPRWPNRTARCSGCRRTAAARPAPPLVVCSSACGRCSVRDHRRPRPRAGGWPACRIGERRPGQRLTAGRQHRQAAEVIMVDDPDRISLTSSRGRPSWPSSSGPAVATSVSSR